VLKLAPITVRWFVWPIIMIFIIGCDSPKKIGGLADLENPDPAVRIRAIKWAGENQVHQAVPLLVDRLQEQNRSVRFYAIMALSRITGNDMGFNYKADPAARAEAVKKWRQSLNNK
jgi:hypothetical protein